MAPAGIRYPNLPKQEDGALHVITLDVGQADATLIMYKGKTLLIDAGTARSEPHKVEQRLPRRLDALLGKRHVDYFLVTHYHRDHFGWPGGQRSAKYPTGIFALVEREGLTIGTVLDRGSFTLSKHKSAGMKHFERAVNSWVASGAVGNRRELRPHDHIDLGEGLTIDVLTANGNGQLDKLHALFPSLIDEYHPTENDYSLGVKITLGDFELFTAGDLSGANVLKQYGRNKESYNDLESRIAHEVGAVEVYRVNHHGSRYSSNDCFVEVLSPQVSVVSSGLNSYGHPDRDVYARLRRYGAVRITGGADVRMYESVKDDIVGDDVELVVSPDGKSYWVNGVPYDSRSEAVEAGIPNRREACVDTLGQVYERPTHEHMDDNDAD